MNWSSALTDQLLNEFGSESSAKIWHVNIGSTKEWGYPSDTSGWSNYWRYPMEIWQKNPNPSLVLIDGRMRKACFAASLLNAESETTILFDDYSDRSHYHEVEQIVKPSLIIGRMAEFIIHPKMIDKRMFKELIPWFFSLQ